MFHRMSGMEEDRILGDYYIIINIIIIIYIYIYI